MEAIIKTDHHAKDQDPSDFIWVPGALRLSGDFDRIMSGEGPSELPQFYGSKTSDGEIVKRPREGEVTALGVVASPTRVYHPSQRPMSPERGVIESETEGGRIGLRRRPSAPGLTPRVLVGDYDLRRSPSGRRPIRIREEAYWDERDYERGYRQDANYAPDERFNRPPRSYKNYDAYPQKPYFEETRIDYHPEDEPRIPNKRRRRDDEESVDGYNYNGPQHREAQKPISFRSLSKEERAEVMRLPWTEWMNSEVKNR